MNSLLKTAGRAVIAATLLSASLSAPAQDSSARFLASKAPMSRALTSTTAPAAYPESWSERSRLARHPTLAPGQGQGKTCDLVFGDKARAAVRLAQGADC